MTESNIEFIDQEMVNKIESLKDRKQFDEALILCETLITRYQDMLLGYRYKADILVLQGNRDAALKVREKLAEIGSEEPVDYYNLARMTLAQGDNKNCIRWADICLELGEQYDSVYYRQAAFFCKAMALVNLCEYEQALNACSHLDPGYDMHVSGKGMVTKDEIESQCKIEIERKSSRQKKWSFD